MLTYHYMIEPIFNRNFVNTFHNHNGTNKRQQVHKPTDQQYQYISFQISSKFSIQYLK